MAACAALLAGELCAQDFANLKTAYTASLTRIQAEADVALAELAVGYAGALKKLESSLQSKGDLDGVLAVRAERELFEKSGALGDHELPSLALVRARFLAARAPIDAKEAADTGKLTESYVRQLSALQVSLTKSGDLPAAVAVKEEIAQVKSRLPTAGPASSAPVPAPAAATVSAPPVALSNTLEKVWKSPARFQVEKMTREKLVESEKPNYWGTVSPKLIALDADIYVPLNPRFPDPTAEIEVTGDGYLVLACRFQDKVGEWSEESFMKGGWNEIRDGELGGPLLYNDDHDFRHTVVYKEVKKGDKLALRCHTYFPPYPIVVNSAAASTRAP